MSEITFPAPRLAWLSRESSLLRTHDLRTKSHQLCEMARRFSFKSSKLLHFCLGNTHVSLPVIHASCACFLSSSNISRSLLVVLVVVSVSPLSDSACCDPRGRRCSACFSQDSAIF